VYIWIEFENMVQWVISVASLRIGAEGYICSVSENRLRWGISGACLKTGCRSVYLECV